MFIRFRSRFRSVWQLYGEECVLFFVLLFIASGLLFYHYSSGLLFPHDHLNGAYLGYDNYSRFTTIGGIFDICHPFLNPLYALNQWVFISVLGSNTTLLFGLFLMALCVVGGNMCVFVYLRRLLALPLHRSLILTALLFSSFTCLTLCFTLETYPVSFFLLSLSITHLSFSYRKHGVFRQRWIWTHSFLLGGITLTNMAKSSLIIFLNKYPVKQRIKRFFNLSFVFGVSVLIIGFFFLLRSQYHDRSEDPVHIARSVFNARFTANNPIEEYFGHPLFISDLRPAPVDQEIVLRPTDYSSVLSYIFPLGFLCVLVLAPILHYKEKLIWILPIYLSIDVFVNILVGYGMNEAIIFGGHWVFLLPLLLGWIYKKLPQKRFLMLDFVLSVLVLVQFVHNLDIVIFKIHP